MFKNMTVLLYTYFFNISLIVLRPTVFNIYDLTFLRSPNISEITIKVGPKNNTVFPTLSAPAKQNCSFQ